MNIAKRVADAAVVFYVKNDNVPETGDNGRYRSWEHCYLAFREAREERKRNGRLNGDRYDYLSLHLAFYLASWGMYRGSSFLLSQDYKVHGGAVREILKEKYDQLQDVTCSELNDQIGLLFGAEGKIGLSGELKRMYKVVRVRVVGKNVKCGVSETLITKILMGTLGCVPAYDRYFVDGIKEYNIKPACFSQKSIQSLAMFYAGNEKLFEETRTRLRIQEGDIEYPQMKLLDMGFWQIGKENEMRRKR